MGLAIFNSLSKLVSSVGYQTKKHLPEILIASGIVGGTAATVFACVATVKSLDVVEETKEDLEAISKKVEDPKEEYTEEEASKDKKKVYMKSAGKIALNYAPAAGLYVASTISILGGAGILNKRNAVLASSLAATIGEFDEYRKKLREKFGEDGERIDKELRFGTKTLELKEKVTDDDGKTKTIKKKVDSVDDETDFDGYRRLFDPRNPYWDKDQTYNEVFLSARQAMFNDKLRAHGYVFLNEVLEELGYQKTHAGQVVGWVFDPNNPNIDNYIDFGITPVEIIRKDGTNDYKVVENGNRTSGFLLDFNVDGSVLNRAPFPDQK